MTNDTKQSKPFLRVLKLAYKLHKAGLSMLQTEMFLGYARNVSADALPSAAASPGDILTVVYNETNMPKGTVVELADALGYQLA